MEIEYRKLQVVIFSLMLIISGLLSVFSLSSPETIADVQEEEIPRYGGTLIFLRLADSSTLNPLLTIDDASFQVANQIFSSLIDRGLDEEGRMIYRPDLAERWEISEDGLTYTFYLRKNVKWHDGVPFTSADVKFTFDLYLDPELALPQRGFYECIDYIETPDDYTVVFHLKYPSPVLMPLGFAFWRNHMIIPKHLYEGTDIWNNPYNEKPIGTGPFKFVEWVKGDYILLEKNEDYYIEGLPYLDRIIFKIAPNTAAQLAALEAGEAGCVNYVPEPEVKRLMEVEGIYVFPIFKAIGLTNYIAFNQGEGINGNPILQNKKVRHAIVHALNRQEIIDLALGGFGKVQHSWISSELKEFYEPNVPKYEYDPEKANRLLDEAGYPRGPDGIRFTLRLYHVAGDVPRERASEIIKSQLAEVGIEVEIITADWPTIKEWLTVKYDFDLCWFGHATGPDPDRLYVYYHGSQITPGSWQFVRYNNLEVNELWDESRKTVDPATRAELFKKMQMIMMEDLPIIPIQERVLFAAGRTEFKGLDKTGAYWYANHFDRVWWTGGSLATPEAAKSKIQEVEEKLGEYETKRWRDVDKALAKLEEARVALKEGDYDKAVALAEEALEIPRRPAPIGLYAGIAIIVLGIVSMATYYFVRRKGI